MLFIKCESKVILLYIIFPFVVSNAFLEASDAQELNYVTVEDLANVKDIGGHARGAISVSPDGKWVVFQLQSPELANGDFDLTWMALSINNSLEPKRIADGGEINLNPTRSLAANGNRPEVRAAWSPDSKRFAYTVKRNNEVQIWLSYPDRQGQQKLTYGQRNVIDFSWSRDGSKLIYQTGADKEELGSVFADEEKSGFLFDDRFYLGAKQEWGKHCESEGGAAIKVGPEYDCERLLWVYDFKTKSQRLAAVGERKAYQSLRLGEIIPAKVRENRHVESGRRWRESGQFAWLENENPDKYAGFTPPLRVHAYIDGEVFRCAPAECIRHRVRNDERLWWSEDGREVIFTRRDGWNFSEMAVYAWAPLTDEVRNVFKSKDSWLSDCVLVGERLICLYETLTSPRKIISISLDDGNIRTLYDPNPEFSNRKFPKIEKLEWEDRFANPTHGFLVYPRDYDADRSYPLVFVTYTAKGFLRGGIGDEYPVFPMAAEGFFVLSHDRPLNLEIFEKEKDPNPALFNDLYWREATLSSQEIIIDRLVTRGLVSPIHIGMTGLSEGAAQVFYALIHSRRFATFIASGGQDNYSSYHLYNEKIRDLRKLIYKGAPDNSNSYWRDIALDSNVDEVDAPLLLNVSDAEAVGNITNVSLLQDADKPVEMYIFHDGHHIKWRPDQRLSIYRRNIQWLKFWLKGQVSSDPVSRGQNERWLQLCQQHLDNLASLKALHPFEKMEHFEFCKRENIK